MPVDFKFVPISGPLSGSSFETQIESALNELGQAIDSSNETAQEALATAGNASSAAYEALNTANTASGLANEAQVTASYAKDRADQAIEQAENSYDTAVNAKSVADNADNTAKAAQNMAAEALTNAAAAQQTADNAQSAAAIAEEQANLAMQAASGVYITMDEALNANEIIEAVKYYVTNPASENLPFEPPLFLTSSHSDPETQVCQVCCSAAGNRLAMRMSVELDAENPELSTWSDWNEIGREALELAGKALSVANNTQAMVGKPGIYVNNAKNLNLDEELEPQNLFLTSKNLQNSPIASPLYFECGRSDGSTHATQRVWNSDTELRRTGIITSIPNAGTDAFDFVAMPVNGASTSGSFHITCVPGQNLSGSFTPGSFTADLATVSFLRGDAHFTLNDFTDGTLSIAGIEIARIVGEEVHIAAREVAMEKGMLAISSIMIRATEAVIGMAFQWMDVQKSTAAWGEWYGFTEKSDDGALSGSICAFSGSFGGSGNKFPINGRTGLADLSHALCDGGTYISPDGRSVTTPNLRDRFIVGAGGTYAAGAAGGAATETTSTNGEHAHTQGDSGATTLATSQIPSHSHSITSTASQVAPYNYLNLRSTTKNDVNTKTDKTNTTGGSGAHTHTNPNTSNTGGHTHTVTTIPPYYALAFIMKL